MGTREVLQDLLELSHARITKKRYKLSAKARDAAKKMGYWPCQKLMRHLQAEGVEFLDGYQAALDQQVERFRVTMQAEGISRREVCRRTKGSRTTFKAFISSPVLHGKVHTIVNVAAALELPLFSVEYASSRSTRNVNSTTKVEASKLECSSDAPEHVPVAAEPARQKNPEHPTPKDLNFQLASENERLKLEVADRKQRLANSHKPADVDPNLLLKTKEPPGNSSTLGPASGPPRQKQADPTPEKQSPPPSTKPESKTAGARPTEGNRAPSSPNPDQQPSNETAIDPEVLPTGKSKRKVVTPDDDRSPYFEMFLENRKLRRKNTDLEMALREEGRNNIAGGIGMLAGACTTTVIHDVYGYTTESAIGNFLTGLASFTLGQLLCSKFPTVGRGFQSAGVGMVAMDGFQRLFHHLRPTGAERVETNVPTNKRATETFPPRAFNPMYWEIIPTPDWWSKQIDRALEAELPDVVRRPVAPELESPTATKPHAEQPPNEPATAGPAEYPSAERQEVEIDQPLDLRTLAEHEVVGSRDRSVPSQLAKHEPSGEHSVMIPASHDRSEVGYDFEESGVMNPFIESLLRYQGVFEAQIRRAQCVPGPFFFWQQCFWMLGPSEGPRDTSEACWCAPEGEHFFSLKQMTTARIPTSCLCPFDAFAPLANS